MDGYMDEYMGRWIDVWVDSKPGSSQMKSLQQPLSFFFLT